VLTHGGTMSVTNALDVSDTKIPAQAIQFDTNAINQLVAEVGGFQLGLTASSALDQKIGEITAQAFVVHFEELRKPPSP
jgi:hypothetical protein